MNHIHLHGSDAVERGGYQMKQAAESFRNSVGLLDEMLRAQREFMNDWIARFEGALNAARDARPGNDGERR